MSWDALGAIGEILGAVAVFLTLLYLAIQIKQTNRMARFETTREIMGQFNACNHLYATDATIREFLLKKDELLVEEAEQFYSYVDMYCNAWGTAQTAFDQGLVDKAIFDSVIKDVAVAYRAGLPVFHQEPTAPVICAERFRCSLGSHLHTTVGDHV